MNRNELTLKKKHSDRKLTIDEHLELRVKYLPQERVVWRELGLLKDCGTPNTVHFANADEVPGTLSQKNPRQVSEKDEKVQTRAPPIVYHDKYMVVTWMPFINDVTLHFCVLILRAGPTIVAKELPVLQRKYPNLLLLGNSTAFVNNGMWQKAVKHYACKTKALRGANFINTNPTKNVILYSDNCTMHSTDPQKLRHKRLYKIHERSSIPNATHVQQPVDQHVGCFIQEYVAEKYWRWGEKLLDDEDDGKRDGMKKEGIKTVCAKVCEWTNEAVIEARKRPQRFRHGLILDCIWQWMHLMMVIKHHLLND